MICVHCGRDISPTERSSALLPSRSPLTSPPVSLRSTSSPAQACSRRSSPGHGRTAAHGRPARSGHRNGDAQAPIDPKKLAIAGRCGG